MSWNNFLHCCSLGLLLNLVSGSLLYVSWYGIRSLMREAWDIALIYGMLKGVIVFCFIPFLPVTLAFHYHVLGYWPGARFLQGTGAILRAAEAVWLAGFLLRLAGLLVGGWRAKRRFRRGSLPASLKLRRACEEVRERMKIRRSVQVRVKYMTDSAFVTGLLHPVIYLPVEEWEEREREVVLTHEMIHIRRLDALWKLLAALLRCVYWFYPPVSALGRAVDEWSESSCDRDCCEILGSSRAYFDILIRLASHCEREESAWSAGLFGSRRDLHRRIAVMRENQRKKRLRRSLAALTAFLFFFAGSTAVSAATVSALNACEAVYAAGLQDEGNAAVCGEEETEGTMNLRDIGEEDRIYFDDETLPASQTVCFAWTLPAGKMGLSSTFSLSKGDSFPVAAVGTPTDSRVRIGLIDSSDTFRYVEGSGALSHTFPITKTDQYCFAVYNLSSGSVTVSGSYVR